MRSPARQEWVTKGGDRIRSETGELLASAEESALVCAVCTFTDKLLVVAWATALRGSLYVPVVNGWAHHVAHYIRHGCGANICDASAAGRRLLQGPPTHLCAAFCLVQATHSLLQATGTACMRHQTTRHSSSTSTAYRSHGAVSAAVSSSLALLLGLKWTAAGHGI